MLQSAVRGFAGGGAKPKQIDPKTTDYDIIFVGGVNATALAKFTQSNEFTKKKQLKMCVVSPQGKYVNPQLYFPVAHSHIGDLDLPSAAVNAQIENWSKTDIGTKVTKIDPVNNSLDLANGSKYTYKALVLAPGLDHSMDHIKGL